MGEEIPPYLAQYDSTTSILLGLESHFQGERLVGLGLYPPRYHPVARVVAGLINSLPPRPREILYRYTGWYGASKPEDTGSIDIEQTCRWVIARYPARLYPGVFIGSTNAAAAHLAAALDMPWLPQTFLAPVRHPALDIDQPAQMAEWAKGPAAQVVEANPDVQLHHMADPAQDRLMLRRMTYFRLKKRALGEAYLEFLEQALLPGACIFTVDCTWDWPTTSTGERQLFQFGGTGGFSPEEYYEGGPRVLEFLRDYGAGRWKWKPPQPDGRMPEAEWGFERELLADVRRLAARRGYRLRRLVFHDPDDLSPLVADLHAWWYESQGLTPRPLLVEAFAQLQVYRVLTRRLVPFWVTFNMEPSAEAVERYLEERPPFVSILLQMVSHGVENPGLVPVERWRELLDSGSERGAFVGLDAGKYPRDFAQFVRYGHQLDKEVKERFPPSYPLSVEHFERFLAETPHRYAVEIIREDG